MNSNRIVDRIKFTHPSNYRVIIAMIGLVILFVWALAYKNLLGMIYTYEFWFLVFFFMCLIIFPMALIINSFQKGFVFEKKANNKVTFKVEKHKKIMLCITDLSNEKYSILCCPNSGLSERARGTFWAVYIKINNSFFKLMDSPFKASVLSRGNKLATMLNVNLDFREKYDFDIPDFILN